jgi:hypothetical protein
MLPPPTRPRLTDVMHVAEWAKAHGVPTYIGLSTEGLTDDCGTYLSREHYHPSLVRYIKLFNDGRIDSFPWSELALRRAASLAS